MKRKVYERKKKQVIKFSLYMLLWYFFVLLWFIWYYDFSQISKGIEERKTLVHQQIKYFSGFLEKWDKELFNDIILSLE